MAREKVLFLCIHNSARSQMAEAFLNHLGRDFFDAKSAGLEPGRLNPFVILAMREVGHDLSGARTKSVFDLHLTGEEFGWVVTVCDAGSAERCPAFPGGGRRLHWGFPDPSALAGTHEENLARVRLVRDTIRTHVANWVARARLREVALAAG